MKIFLKADIFEMDLWKWLSFRNIWEFLWAHRMFDKWCNIICIFVLPFFVIVVNIIVLGTILQLDNFQFFLIFYRFSLATWPCAAQVNILYMFLSIFYLRRQPATVTKRTPSRKMYGYFLDRVERGCMEN